MDNNLEDNKDNILSDVEVNNIQEQTKSEYLSETSDIKTDTNVVEVSNIKSVNDNIHPASRKRILQGVVVSNKPDKTIVVKFVRQVAHPLYKKYYKQSKKVMAHDENNECNIGDVVNIKEHRPLSSKKRWQLLEIVQRAK
jgi:small subunit ribosomal protein S17